MDISKVEVGSKLVELCNKKIYHVYGEISGGLKDDGFLLVSHEHAVLNQPCDYPLLLYTNLELQEKFKFLGDPC